MNKEEVLLDTGDPNNFWKMKKKIEDSGTERRIFINTKYNEWTDTYIKPGQLYMINGLPATVTRIRWLEESYRYEVEVHWMGKLRWIDQLFLYDKEPIA